MNNYRLSKLTGKLYLDNIEIIQDDRLQEWNDFLSLFLTEVF